MKDVYFHAFGLVSMKERSHIHQNFYSNMGKFETRTDQNNIMIYLLTMLAKRLFPVIPGTD